MQAGKGPNPLSEPPVVVSSLLFQAILAYEHRPALDEYTTFVVGVKGNTYQFIGATCSRLYIEDLVNRKAPGSPVDVYFSEPFDLLEQDDRREFSKIFIGLLNCMHNLLRTYYDD